MVPRGAWHHRRSLHRSQGVPGRLQNPTFPGHKSRTFWTCRVWVRGSPLTIRTHSTGLSASQTCSRMFFPTYKYFCWNPATYVHYVIRTLRTYITFKGWQLTINTGTRAGFSHCCECVRVGAAAGPVADIFGHCATRMIH